MSDLTTEEKVYLVECFFSRGKVYSDAYRGFCTKYGTHRVASENTLKRWERIMHIFTCITLASGKRHFLTFFLLLKCFFYYIFYRVIDNFVEYGTLQDRRHDVSGRPVWHRSDPYQWPQMKMSRELKTMSRLIQMLSDPNRKAAQALKIYKTSLHRIL